MTDGVGVVSIAQQKKLMNKRRKSAKLKIKTDDKSNEIVDAVNSVSTPSSPSKRKRKVRIIEAQKNKNNNDNDENKEEHKEHETVKPLKVKNRSSMKTPKASSEKTWSHAMDNFKSVKKR